MRVLWAGRKPRPARPPLGPRVYVRVVVAVTVWFVPYAVLVILVLRAGTPTLTIDFPPP